MKKILSKGDDKILNVVDDISLAEEASRLSGNEMGRVLTTLLQTLQALEGEGKRVNSLTTHSESLTADVTEKYLERISAILNDSRGRSLELSRLKVLMARKVTEVVEYFGEDPVSCDTTKLFSVLMEFRRAVIASRDAAMRRLKAK